MKQLSTVWKLYLIIMLDVFTIISSFLALAIVGNSILDFVKTNLVFKLFSFLVILFVNMNLAQINNKFKKMFIWKIISDSISFFAFLLNEKYILSILVFDKYDLSDILKIVALVVALPNVYYWFGGFCDLAKKNDQNKLCQDWKNLGLVFMGVSVSAVIGSAVSLLGLLTESYLLSFIFGIFLPTVMLIADIIEFFMIVKTAKVLRAAEK